ncbi:PGF-pre-PGF domain-containing protein [Halosolutus gelatinilyticus]|uniref:PGF-pre-PGF domain-containing protein n=1 Tax=Halosolutus gelatinilyticus TaxID=2931975 RepID=UPI001FF1CFBF|nr:PGF-pre-PGF domain-containing protein [Halosolutus gelatinilyticus]
MTGYTTPRRRWVRFALAGVVFVLAFAVAPPVAGTPPPPPAAYYGELTADGEPIPAGVTVTATVGGEVRGELTTADAGRYGGAGAFDPKLQVDGTTDDEGAIVRFYVDGVEADPTVQWHAGDVRTVDLDVNGYEIDDGTGSPGGPGGFHGGDFGGGTIGDGDDSNGSATPLSVSVAPTPDSGVDVVVHGARAGVSASIAVDGDDADGLALDGLDVTPTVDGNFSLSISESRTAPAAGETFSSIAAGEPLGYVVVDHTIADGDIDDVTFRFRVADAQLVERDLRPDAVSLYRLHDGTWTELPTRHVGTSRTFHAFEAESPGLSVFAIAPRATDRTGESPSESETEPPSEADDSRGDRASDGATFRRFAAAAGVGAVIVVTVAIYWFKRRR